MPTRVVPFFVPGVFQVQPNPLAAQITRRFVYAIVTHGLVLVVVAIVAYHESRP